MTLQELLERGITVTNGPQYMTWYPKSNIGYLSCGHTDCCDTDFKSISEILEWIGTDQDEWEEAAC